MYKFKKFIALINLLVFLIPTFIMLHHTFEKHEHSHENVCNAKTKQHFHKKADKECKLCSFTVASFSIPPTIYLQDVLVISTEKFYPKEYIFIFSALKMFFSLRAPPLN